MQDVKSLESYKKNDTLLVAKSIVGAHDVEEANANLPKRSDAHVSHP